MSEQMKTEETKAVETKTQAPKIQRTAIDLDGMKRTETGLIHPGLLKDNYLNKVHAKKGLPQAETELTMFFNLKGIDHDILMASVDDRTRLQLYEEFMNFCVNEILARLGLNEKKVGSEWAKLRKWILGFREFRAKALRQ